MRLLVTGFGPFPRMPRNPSGEVAEAVAVSPRLRLHGVEARAAVLTTAYAALASELDPLLAAEPEIALLLGVAGRSAMLRVEERATPRRSTLFPDIRGDRPAQVQGGAAEPFRRTRVNTGSALRCLEGHRLPARLSHDAGRYLCNAAYFRALSRPGPTLFIHMPKPPRPRPPGKGRMHPVGAAWRRAVAAALVDIVLVMAREARRDGFAALSAAR